MNSLECNQILRTILGEEKMAEFLEYTDNCIKFKYNKKPSIMKTITVSNVSCMLVLLIGANLAKERTLKQVESLLSQKIKNGMLGETINEFYDIYKDYIDIVKKYVSRMDKKQSF